MTFVASTGESEHGSGPALVGANWYRFRPNERIAFSEVASVCFIWPVQGTGVIRSRGRTFTLNPSTLLRLPWRHDVEYVADARSPFNVGTIHLVPQHDAGPIEPRVAFLHDDALLRSSARRGVADERPATIPRGSTAARRLVELGGYAVDRFHQGALDPSILRSLAVLIVDADESRARADADADGLPPALGWMTEYVLGHLSQPLTVAEIAAVGGCSVATAERIFSRHTGQSLHAWVQRRRLEEAARLLRTTGLPISTVANLVGFADPQYFSRAFRAAYSVPPSRYAALQLRP